MKSNNIRNISIEFVKRVYIEVGTIIFLLSGIINSIVVASPLKASLDLDREPTALGDLPPPPEDPDQRYEFYRNILLEFCNVTLQDYYAFSSSNMDMMNKYIIALWGYENGSLTKEQVESLTTHDSPNTWFYGVFLWPLSGNLIKHTDAEFRFSFSSQAGLEFLERVIQIDAYVDDDASSSFSESSSTTHHLHLSEIGDFWNFGSVSGDTWYGLMWGLGVVDFEAFITPGYVDSDVEFVIRYVWQHFDIFAGWKTTTTYHQYNRLNLPLIGTPISIDDDDSQAPSCSAKVYQDSLLYSSQITNGYIFEYSNAFNYRLELAITDISYGQFNVYVNNLLDQSGLQIWPLIIGDLGLFSITTDYLEQKYGNQDQYEVKFIGADADNDRPNDYSTFTFLFTFKPGVTQPPPEIASIMGKLGLNTDEANLMQYYSDNEIPYKSRSEGEAHATPSSAPYTLTLDNGDNAFNIRTQLEVTVTHDANLGVSLSPRDAIHRGFTPTSAYPDQILEDSAETFTARIWVQIPKSLDLVTYSNLLTVTVTDINVMDVASNVVLDISDWGSFILTWITPGFDATDVAGLGWDVVGDASQWSSNLEDIKENMKASATIQIIPIAAYKETTLDSGVFDIPIATNYINIQNAIQIIKFRATPAQETAAIAFHIIEIIGDILTYIGEIIWYIVALTSIFSFGASLTAALVGFYFIVAEAVCEAIKWLWYNIANGIDPPDENIQNLAEREYFSPPPIPENVENDPTFGPMTVDLVDSFVETEANLYAYEKTEDKINTNLKSASPDYNAITAQMEYEKELMNDLQDSNTQFASSLAIGLTAFSDLSQQVQAESNYEILQPSNVEIAQNNISQDGLPDYEEQFFSSYSDFHDNDLFTDQTTLDVQNRLVQGDPSQIQTFGQTELAVTGFFNNQMTSLYDATGLELENQISDIKINNLNQESQPLTSSEIQTLTMLKTQVQNAFERGDFDLTISKAFELRDFASDLYSTKSNQEAREYRDYAAYMIEKSRYYKQIVITPIGDTLKTTQSGTSVDYDFYISNTENVLFNHKTDFTVSLSIAEDTLPAGWSYHFEMDGQQISSIHFTESCNKRVKLIVTIPECFSGELFNYDLSIVASASFEDATLFDTQEVQIYVTDDDEAAPVISDLTYNGIVFDGEPSILIIAQISDSSGIVGAFLDILGMQYMMDSDPTIPNLYSVNIPNPRELDQYQFTITATDGDTDRLGDQLSSSLGGEFTVKDDDFSGPAIDIALDNLALNPTGGVIVEFTIVSNDPESGIDLMNVEVLVAGQHFTTLGTYLILITAFGNYSISVDVRNADLDRGVIDQESSTRVLNFSITVDLVKGLVLTEIDAVITKVQSSNEADWRNPASSRKQATIEKLQEIKNLISIGDYAQAYDKLLHDVKPKLTGLKTDENEVAWGNGVACNPWVTSPALQQTFKNLIDPVLRGIKNLIPSTPAPPSCHGHHGGHHHACHPCQLPTTPGAIITATPITNPPTDQAITKRAIAGPAATGPAPRAGKIAGRVAWD